MITEEMLREAAEKAGEALTAYYERDYDPDKPLEIPPEFEKKIERLKRRAKHPVFYKTMRRVASIALAILVAGSAWITVDAEARAAVVGWVKEIYETYFYDKGNDYITKSYVEYREDCKNGKEHLVDILFNEKQEEIKIKDFAN